ncbi:MAG: phosphatase PAP2 family protein [Dehalococcoidia bacterium]
MLDATQLHGPASPVEGLILALSLIAGFACAYRLGGRAFAGLMGLAQYSGFLFVGHPAIPVVVAGALGAALIRRPRRRPDARALLLECAFLGGGLVIYQLGRIATESDFGPARANGLRLMRMEERLGLYVEPRIQDFATSHSFLGSAVDGFYSFGFMAFVSAVLVFLFCTDRPNYRLLRNCLGLSAALAVLVIALYPTAPPRLLAEAGIIDTVVANGRTHNFTNEFAAVPSLHVGWMALAGYVLARSLGGRYRVVIATVPGVAMALTVMATGNHFWIDGVIGVVVALAPALLLTSVHFPRFSLPRPVLSEELRGRWALAMSRSKTRFTVASLAGLLTYLVVGQLQAPGFTDFWGYLVFQMAATLVILVGFEVAFARQGGVSWVTHIVAVSCGYLDVLGTTGDLYAKIDEYDKLTHFMGTAAITSGAYDVFRAMYLSGSVRRVAQDRVLAAMCFGTAVGIGWEVYEFLGDKVFNSARVQGRWDTLNDIISDFLGALMVVVILAWLERGARDVEPASAPASTDAQR